MQSARRTKIISHVFRFLVITIFLLPVNYVSQSMDIDISNYLFLLVFLCALFVVYWKKKFNISIYNFVFSIFIIIVAVVQKSLVPLHLISLVLVDDFIDNKIEWRKAIDQNKKFLMLAILGLALYSIVFFGKEGRFIFIGSGEVNITGLAVFGLYVILKRYYPRVAVVVLGLGIFTFSKSYILAILIYFFLGFVINKSKTLTTAIFRICTYKNMMLLSVALLIVFSMLFNYKLAENELGEYVSSGVERFTSIFDYSNYFRFSVNTNTLLIYKEHPNLLFTGIPSADFFDYSFRVTQLYGFPYRAIKPHNFFFSYLQIYGLMAIPIFIYLGHIFNRIVDKKNVHIFVAFFSYATFLGMGFVNYWLLWTCIALITNGERDKK